MPPCCDGAPPLLLPYLLRVLDYLRAARAAVRVVEELSVLGLATGFRGRGRVRVSVSVRVRVRVGVRVRVFVYYCALSARPLPRS